MREIETVLKKPMRMKWGNGTVYETAKVDVLIASDDRTNISFTTNRTDDFLHYPSILSPNISDVYFDDSMWGELQPHDWSKEASCLLSQPPYVVTLILCVLALTANISSIMAVKHIKSPLTMHLRFIINLAASDIALVFGVLIHILNQIFNRPFALEVINPSDRLVNSCIFAIVSSIDSMTYLISLFNVLTLAIDHYIAILFPLSYQRIMSTNHSTILITSLWVIATVGGFSNFLFGVIGYREKRGMFNYCEYIMYDSYHPDYLVFCLTLLCLTVITYIYMRIYCEVLRLQVTCSTPNDISHNRKALTTTLLIIGAFCVCWLPNCIFQITMVIKLYVSQSIMDESFNTFILISKYLYILQVTNSLVDPIIYAIRLKIVKSGYRNCLIRLKKSLRRCMCCKIWRRRRRKVRISRRSTLPSEEVLKGFVGSTSRNVTNHSSDLHESLCLTNVTSKLSDGSDINENEIHAMVTFHGNEIQTLIDSINETQL